MPQWPSGYSLSLGYWHLPLLSHGFLMTVGTLLGLCMGNYQIVMCEELRSERLCVHSAAEKLQPMTTFGFYVTSHSTLDLKVNFPFLLYPNSF